MRIKNFKPIMEAGGRKSIVDKLGYLPTDQRIDRMQKSGIRLAAASAELFDGFSVEGEDMVVPPWRQKDFDIAEGAQFLRNAAKLKDEYLREQRIRKAKAKAEELKRQAQPDGEVQVLPAAGKQGRAAPANGRQTSSEGSGGE